VSSQPPVLVTGAGSGIGRACAVRLAGAGHPVAMVDRAGDRLAAAAAECGDGAPVSTHVADLTDPVAVAGAVGAAASAHGGLGAVANVAGAVRAGSAVDTSDADWRWTVDTNLSSAFYVCRAALPHLLRRGSGAVVNVASLTALRPMPDRAAYAAAKGGLIAFTRQLALEYGPYGITVNTVCPGAIRTPLLVRRLDAEPQVEAELRERIPLRRLGEPAEVAALLQLLLTGGCGYLTGQTLVVDGGLSLV
jgi:NAD(P)-dependent dehydrogenase (short-subunit alcohol dehydrogenase family)